MLLAVAEDVPLLQPATMPPDNSRAIPRKEQRARRRDDFFEAETTLLLGVVKEVLCCVKFVEGILNECAIYHNSLQHLFHYASRLLVFGISVLTEVSLVLTDLS